MRRNRKVEEIRAEFADTTIEEDIICFDRNYKGHISRKCLQRVAQEKTNDERQLKKCLNL